MTQELQYHTTKVTNSSSIGINIEMVDMLRIQSITVIWRIVKTTAAATSETISSATRHSMRLCPPAQIPMIMLRMKHLVCFRVVAMA